MREGLRALELRFLNTQLSLLVAEELALGLEQCNTQTELSGQKYLLRWLKQGKLCSAFSKAMMDQIMKVNDSIMKPAGELTLDLGEGKNPTAQV